jgi:hypothetical protein
MPFSLFGKKLHQPTEALVSTFFNTMPPARMEGGEYQPRILKKYLCSLNPE